MTSLWRSLAGPLAPTWDGLERPFLPPGVKLGPLKSDGAFVKKASLLSFSLCPVLLLSSCSHRCWSQEYSLINVLLLVSTSKSLSWKIHSAMIHPTGIYESRTQFPVPTREKNKTKQNDLERAVAFQHEAHVWTWERLWTTWNYTWSFV